MTAAVSIANIVKSSLGPVGLDKMLVDEVGVSDCLIYLIILVCPQSLFNVYNEKKCLCCNW